jgi:hypothetical protein
MRGEEEKNNPDFGPPKSLAIMDPLQFPPNAYFR